MVQPDILFIAKKNPLVIDNRGLKGVPDLIIEILSPGNKKYDLAKKRKLYEKFGVKEYWVVDPETKIATGFLLKGSGYASQKESRNQLHSAIFRTTFSFLSDRISYFPVTVSMIRSGTPFNPRLSIS